LGRGEVDTGEVAALIAEAGWAHEAKRDQFWQGNPSEPAAEGPRRPRQTEGFLGEGQREFSFALALGAAWVPLTRLRALVWLAAETGASRAWVTPDGTLLFEGIPATGRQLWEDWLAASRMPETRGDLDRCVVAAGWGAGVVAARAEVLAALRRVAQMPPSRQLLVADDGLNRHDGVCSRPFPVLIRTTDSWLYRTGDGQNSGEGTLEEALEGLEAPGAGGVAPGEASQGTLAARFRCGSCLSVYDQRYGDPLGGVGAGIPFENLSPTWCCPVCGASRTIFLPAED
jgi:rubredoxin